MKRHDWLLLAIGGEIEPIQLQKTLFKFAMESGAPSDELYPFSAYNWGPCSLEIYDDLTEMRESGLVEFVPSGRGWSLYRLAKPGRERERMLRKDADSILLKKLDDARGYVTGRDFETLLSDIYREYPDFATESLFRK